MILKENLENLGEKHDLVKVKPGYARNFLIPRGYAMPANKGNRKMQEEILRQREHKEAKARDEANKILEDIKETPLKVKAKVGDQGKIFGSVNTIQLAEAIKARGYTVDRKNITIKDSPIKTVGTYEAFVRLHKDVEDTVNFEVVEES